MKVHSNKFLALLVLVAAPAYPMDWLKKKTKSAIEQVKNISIKAVYNGISNTIAAHPTVAAVTGIAAAGGLAYAGYNALTAHPLPTYGEYTSPNDEYNRTNLPTYAAYYNVEDPHSAVVKLTRQALLPNNSNITIVDAGPGKNLAEQNRKEIFVAAGAIRQPVEEPIVVENNQLNNDVIKISKDDKSYYTQTIIEHNQGTWIEPKNEQPNEQANELNELKEESKREIFNEVEINIDANNVAVNNSNKLTEDDLRELNELLNQLDSANAVQPVEDNGAGVFYPSKISQYQKKVQGKTKFPRRKKFNIASQDKKVRAIAVKLHVTDGYLLVNKEGHKYNLPMVKYTEPKREKSAFLQTAASVPAVVQVKIQEQGFKALLEQDNDGNTSLHRAVMARNKEDIKAIVKQIRNWNQHCELIKNMRNNKGESVWDLAIIYKNKDKAGNWHFWLSPSSIFGKINTSIECK